MFSLLDDGAISSLLERAGVPPRRPVRDVSPDYVMPSTPAQGWGMLSMEPGATPPAKRQGFLGRMGTKLSGLLGGDTMPAGYEELVTPADLARVKTSLPGKLLNLTLGLQTPSGVTRAKLQELMQTRMAGKEMQQERALRAGRERMFRDIASELAAASTPAALNLVMQKMMANRMAAGDEEYFKMMSGGALSAVQPDTPKVPTPDEPQIVRNVIGPDGKPHVQGVLRDGTVVWDKVEIAPPKDTSVGAALQGQRDYTRTMGLRDDYANDPNIKRAKDYASAFQGIVAAAQDSNPQTNLAMMYEAVKMRDPNAVREGELALQRRARSVPGWLYGLWDKAAKGNVLTTTERQQIVVWAQEKVEQQRKLVVPVQARFGEQARRFNVASDIEFIAPDPFAGVELRTSTGTASGETKEQMWNRLVKGGMAPDEATAAVRRARP